ncbi:MAG: phosphoribosylformylglycinamidine cyclo-ligase [Pseudobdellovibrionaceae bacterium]
MIKKGAYAKAGVDRVAADLFVDRIKPLIKKTLNDKVAKNVSGYASLYKINKDQFIAASTDGVGTKLRLAFEYNSHHTVGIDLVAMSVNDLLCVGASPLFFLDYFATGKLKTAQAVSVVSGITEGCAQAESALVGGETAEMPSFYADGEYDLAGFAVGLADKKNLLPKTLKPGDVLLGLPSSGFHSNGYSLVRKLFKDWKVTGKTLQQCPWAKSKKHLAKELLTPTQIYVKALKELLSQNKIKGLAHITGSGFLNVPRMSEAVSYEIFLPPLRQRPLSYQWLASLEQKDLPFSELIQTFNMGIGMVIACDAKNVESLKKSFKKKKQPVVILGQCVKKSKNKCQVSVRDHTNSAVLEYS